MELADGIRKHGFRKWYERELMRSHAHLLLTLACAIGMFAAFEVYDRRSSIGDQLINAGAISLCAAIGFRAVRRYLGMLAHAEATANQAKCSQCETYGRFTLVAEDDAHGTVQVRCRKCEHKWVISE